MVRAEVAIVSDRAKAGRFDQRSSAGTSRDQTK